MEASLEEWLEQALRFEAPAHVRDRLVERLAATLALAPLPVNPVSDMPPVDREISEHGLLRSLQDHSVEATRGGADFTVTAKSYGVAVSAVCSMARLGRFSIGKSRR